LEALEAREANPDVRLIYLLRNRRVSTAEVSGVLNSKDTENQGEREVQLLQVVRIHSLFVAQSLKGKLHYFNIVHVKRSVGSH
jgi:hypothetical protein